MIPQEKAFEELKHVFRNGTTAIAGDMKRIENRMKYMWQALKDFDAILNGNNDKPNPKEL